MSYVERLEQIRNRLERATPGPWSTMTEETSDGENIFYTVEAKNEYGMHYGLADMSDSGRQGDDDAEFIAHARQDIPWLLKQLEGRQ